MKTLHLVTFPLVIIGAVNWGLIGLLDYNLVNMVFGSMPMVEKLIYLAVGASAVALIATHSGDCKLCMEIGRKGKRR